MIDYSLLIVVSVLLVSVLPLVVAFVRRARHRWGIVALYLVGCVLPAASVVVGAMEMSDKFYDLRMAYGDMVSEGVADGIEGILYEMMFGDALLLIYGVFSACLIWAFISKRESQKTQ